MKNRKFKTNMIYESAEAFFNLDGNAVMVLSPLAAQEVCRLAAGRKLIILGVDGGIWHPDVSGFEQRIEASWTGIGLTSNIELVIKNNKLAELDILEETALGIHDVFVLTVAPMEKH